MYTLHVYPISFYDRIVWITYTIFAGWAPYKP